MWKRIKQAALFVLRYLEAALKAVLLAGPVLFLMVYVNYTVDRSGYFQGDQFEREVAEALLAGQDLSNYEKMDERQIVRLYVQNLPSDAPLGTVALGSSRILQMDRSVADADAGGFFNAGMIGADVRDVMSTLYLFIREGKAPKNVILGIDPWIFSPSPEAMDIRADAELYEEFLSEALGRQSEYDAPDPVEAWDVLLDPAYFQGNVAWASRDTGDEEHPTTVAGAELWQQDTEVKRSDGSVVYTREMRAYTHDEVELLAVEQGGTALRLNDFDALPPDKLALFDEFIRYGRQNGVNFVFVLVPYHPLAYYVMSQAQAERQCYSGFFAVEPWLREYAAKNHIPLYGSYNAESLGLTGEDFYDGLHCKGSGIAKFFPGMHAVLAGQSGTAALQ